MPETRSRHLAYTLDRIKSLLEFLGNPQNEYKVIHVAGTSGKTSTCYFLSSMLHANGQKVGLSVSPHVDEVNERVQINTKPISEKKFCSEFSLFLRKIKPSGIPLTYFEILVAFGFWEFARQKVDYVVVEVGVGGLLDGTNVFNHSDKVCVITDIGLDHTNILGKTLQAITSQKAGIIKSHNTVFVYEQNDEIMEVIREVSHQQQADLHEIWPLKPSELPKNLPLFQRRNWYLAISVFNFVRERDKLPEMSEQDLAKTTQIYIPARMELVRLKGKTLILDAAHNPQKLDALIKSVKLNYPKKSVAVLVGFNRSKQTKIRENLETMTSLVSHLIATDFVEINLERSSVDPLIIVEQCEEIGFHDWELIRDPKKACRKLLRRKEDVLLVTGSFYLLNSIRPIILKK